MQAGYASQCLVVKGEGVHHAGPEQLVLTDEELAHCFWVKEVAVEETHQGRDVFFEVVMKVAGLLKSGQVESL